VFKEKFKENGMPGMPGKVLVIKPTLANVQLLGYITTKNNILFFVGLLKSYTKLFIRIAFSCFYRFKWN